MIFNIINGVEKRHCCISCFFLFQSLVEKHFPAPDRDKINRILGIGKQKTILDELGKKTLELFLLCSCGFLHSYYLFQWTEWTFKWLQCIQAAETSIKKLKDCSDLSLSD